MPTPVRISEDASLALHAMGLLAKCGDRNISNVEIARSLNGSAHTLAKVLQRLVKARLVHSARGPAGGFVLGRPASELMLLEIYEAIEGPITDEGCLLDSAACRIKRCALGELVQSAHRQMRDYLAHTPLAELASVMEMEVETQGTGAC